MKLRAFVFMTGLILFATMQTFGQGGGGQRGQGGRPPARPAPRDANGRATLSPLPGEVGVWLPGAGGAERLVDPAPGEPDQFPIPAAARFPGKLDTSQ